MKNQILIEKLKSLVKSERKITAEIIELIKEIEQLKLYLENGYTSMFVLLTKEFGYTPSAAQRRIDAARLSSEIPELQTKFENGSINLSQVSMVAQAIRQKQKEEPRKVSLEVKRELMKKVEYSDLIQTQKVLAKELDLTIETYEKKQFQKDDSVRIELTLTQEQFAELERVKELISHQMPGAKLTEVIGYLAQSYLKKRDPNLKQLKRDGQFQEQTVTSEQSTAVPVALSRQILSKDKSPKRREAIPQNLKTFIFQRDQHCQWQDPNSQRKCQSRFQLQIDHKKSVWRNGSNEVENLQLLCSVHNKLKYEQEKRSKYKTLTYKKKIST